jgi:predicted RNA-binding protein with PUA-like domain
MDNNINNIQNGWLGVVGSVQRTLYFEKNPWWCFPTKAKKNDLVLMYCPRSVNVKLQGIFALCKLTRNPDNSDKNYYCSGFGLRAKYGGKGRLFYAKLKFLKRYDETLTAKELKENPVFCKLPFVRRNFQGTCFPIEWPIFNKLVEILESKNSISKNEIK